MTYNTNNPVPSVDVRDLYDNAQNLDSLVNGTAPAYADRLGVSRKSYKGMELDFAAFLASSGFELPALEYVDGSPLTVDRPTQLIERDGILYSVKTTESFPATLTGTWVTDQLRLVVRVDQALRQDLVDGAAVISGLPSIVAFGALAGATDSKPAIDAALASTPGFVHVPVGEFTYSDFMDKDDLYRLEGEGTIKYKGGQIDFSQQKITPFPLTYRTVSVNLDDRDFSAQWQSWLDHMVTQGADLALVLVTNMPDGATGNTFERLPDTKIRDFIELAIANGVRISMIKPHIVVDWDDSFVRSNVLPSNEALHMTNWGIELEYYADLCDEYSIPLLCMTCEQPNQSKASLYSTWQTITGSLRANHPSLKLTAAYTLTETKNNLGFHNTAQLCQANLLDLYGQNVYPSYTNKVYAETSGIGNITIDEVSASMFQSAVGFNIRTPADNIDYIPKMLAARDAFGHDLFITEIGCMNRTDALISVVPPIADVATYKTQALLIEATMKTLATMESVVGIAWWNVLGPFDYFNNSVVTEAEQAMIKYYKEGRV